MPKHDSLQKKKKKTCEKRLHLPKNQLISIKGKHIYYYPMHQRVLFQFINYYPRVRQNLLFHKYIDISKMNTKSLIHVMLGQINISLNIKKHLDIVNIFFKVDLIWPDSHCSSRSYLNDLWKRILTQKIF